MKLLSLLALGCSIVAVLPESTDSSDQALRARALAQLERLAPYRRTPTDRGTTDEQWLLLENVAKDPGSGIDKLSDRQIFEIYRLLPVNLQRDIIDQVGGNRAMIELLANQKYIASMQDRIKRSGSKREVYNHDGYESPPDGYPPAEYPPESYGEYEGHPQPSGSDSGAILKGSGSLIGGLTKGIINGLVSASGSASKGSSSVSAQSSQTSAESSAQSSAQTSSSSSNSGHDKPKPEYGQVYSYSDKAFDVWDFKKAIISTLMQAVKAITGGVIALKGQLLKGGAYLIASKTKLITKTGDAITALGTNIVKNAAHPYAQPPHPGYLYDHPPEVGHEDGYEGPPPGIEEYGESHDGYQGNSNYDSPSNVDDQAGLLIVKPTRPDNHDHHTVDLDIRKPAVTHTEDNYYGPPPGLPDKDVENTVTGNTHSHENYNQDDYNVKPSHQLPSSYDVSIQQHSSNDHINEQHGYPIYPPLDPGSSQFNHHHSPLSVQQSVEYPPIHIQYSIPDKGNSEFNSDANSNDLSVYSSVSIDTDPKIESIKISAELPKLQPHPAYQNLPLLPYSYQLQGPLKIPLLNSYSSPYWQNHGVFQPYANFNFQRLYRRRNSSQRKRSVSEIAQRMRLQQG